MNRLTYLLYIRARHFDISVSCEQNTNGLCEASLTLPPILSLASRIVTLQPWLRRTSAHLRPDTPAPTIPICGVEAIGSNFYKVFKSEIFAM